MLHLLRLISIKCTLLSQFLDFFRRMEAEKVTEKHYICNLEKGQSRFHHCYDFSLCS